LANWYRTSAGNENPDPNAHQPYSDLFIFPSIVSQASSPCMPLPTQKHEIIDVEESNEFVSSIFPNPSNGLFSVRHNGEDILTVAVYTSSGILIHQQSYTSSEFEVNLKGQSGLYIVKIAHQNEVFYHKLVVVR